ncbi:MAG TPA: hypothetical protein PKX92_09050 [Edaphocola sp.]|nr:hypothetical protein [Edaphocola sp.]
MENNNTEISSIQEASKAPTAKGFKKWMKRFGIIGFWFFFIKGLVWIAVAVGAYYGFKLF